MAAFEYQALNPQGHAVKGVMEGDAERQVRALLREKGLTPLRVDVIDRGRPEWTEHLLGSAAFGDAVGVRRAEQCAMGDEEDDHVDVGRYRYPGHGQC